MSIQDTKLSIGSGQSYKTVNIDMESKDIQPYYDDHLKELEGYLAIKQITTALKINRHTVYKWMHEYEPPLPHMRFGNSTIRIHAEDLKKWMYNQFYRNSMNNK